MEACSTPVLNHSGQQQASARESLHDPPERILATATKICTKGYFPPGHPGASTANPCVSPTHCCTCPAATTAARCKSNNASGLSIIHFRSCPLRQVGCYTLLSGSNLHGHRPAISSGQRPLWILCMSQHLNPATALSDHPASPALLTSNGPHGAAHCSGLGPSSLSGCPGRMPHPAEARRLPPSLKHTQAQRTALGTPSARDGL